MIPPVLHHIWVAGANGPTPLPAHLEECVRSWRRHHPFWRHRMWTDDDLGWLEHRDLYDDAAGLVPSDAVGQFRADIARYEILLRHGGVYVDVDTECLRPTDHEFRTVDAFAAAEDDRWVGNTYLASTAGHPVMVDLVGGLRASVAAHPGARPNVATGPRYLTPIWQRHGCHVAAQRDWYPYSWADVRNGTVPASYGDAYAVHHWMHTRQLVGQ